MNPLVSVSWLQSNLADPALIILDASIPKVTGGARPEYLGKAIPGARFFDIKKTFSDSGSHLPNMLPDPDTFAREARNLGINQDSKIVVYDNLGIYSSPRARWMFNIMGHGQVAVLDGGLPEWVKQGYAITDLTKNAFEQGNFEANYQPHLVKHVADVVENLTSLSAQVLDARSEGRFYGTAPEPRSSLRSGHIPQSVSLHYQQVLNEGKFLPVEALREKLDELSLGDSPLIFTCGSGITACIIMLANELVNDNPKAVYDGSWAEWGLDENKLPVEKK